MINKIYFPGLNGVRFIAVLIVILDHTELFKSYFKLNTLWSESYSSHLGSFGVTIFFVLSGYLITYLLLLEKKESGINIKNFYIRRILRIWPLYFILMILGFFILPHLNCFSVPVYQSVENNFTEKFLLFSFFMANIAFVYYPVVAFAGVLWSVAVEEQFYLIWPNIIKRFKNVFFTLFVCLSLYMILKGILLFNILGVNSVLPPKLYKLIERTRFSSMMIGGLGALVIFSGKELFKQCIYNWFVQIFSYIMLALLLLNIVHFPFFDFVKNEFTSFFVAIIVVNISSNVNSLINLENKYLNFLGKVSYGMYIYHSIVAVFCIKLFMYFYPVSSGFYWLWSFLLILTILFFTVFISHLSYKYIEQKILKKKKNYSFLVSGDQVNEK